VSIPSGMLLNREVLEYQLRLCIAIKSPWLHAFTQRFMSGNSPKFTSLKGFRFSSDSVNIINGEMINMWTFGNIV
jgi:hypothetical protein